ncbi:hypothetical protein CN933_24535 [Sinorhizobium sp. M4_45]|nr:hypothetical protein CN933_24535 [Sinorhizobium sp. M4_45]
MFGGEPVLTQICNAHRLCAACELEATVDIAREEHSRIVLTHIEVPQALSGQGVGSRLARACSGFCMHEAFVLSQNARSWQPLLRNIRDMAQCSTAEFSLLTCVALAESCCRQIAAAIHGTVGFRSPAPLPLRCPPRMVSLALQ